MNRVRVPVGHLVDGEGRDTTIPGDRVRLASGDWIKLALYAFGLIGAGGAAWYGLKGDVQKLQIDQGYIKERDDRQDRDSERTRNEMLQELKAINEKLDNPRFRR